MELFVAKQYTRTPDVRYESQSQGKSGEGFRDKLLLPMLNDCIARKEELCVIFDGCRGAGVSFLEEAFGGLIRKGISYSDIQRYLRVVWTNNPRKVFQINYFIKRAYDDQTKD
jgi:hypothetical protein